MSMVQVLVDPVSVIVPVLVGVVVPVFVFPVLVFPVFVGVEIVPVSARTSEY